MFVTRSSAFDPEKLKETAGAGSISEQTLTWIEPLIFKEDNYNIWLWPTRSYVPAEHMPAFSDIVEEWNFGRDSSALPEYWAHILTHGQLPIGIYLLLSNSDFQYWGVRFL